MSVELFGLDYFKGDSAQRACPVRVQGLQHTCKTTTMRKLTLSTHHCQGELPGKPATEASLLSSLLLPLPHWHCVGEEEQKTERVSGEEFHFCFLSCGSCEPHGDPFTLEML